MDKSNPSSSKVLSSLKPTTALAEIELTKRRLTSAKMLLTKAINAVNLDALSDSSKEVLEEEREEIQGRFKTFQQAQTALYDALNSTESLGEEVLMTEMDSLADDDLRYTKKYRTISANLLTKIRALEIPAECSSSSKESPSHQVHSTLKLPDLKIPTFSDNDSDPFAFSKFQSSFQNAISSQEGIKPAVILLYLKSHLKGRALALIENLPNDEDSYAQAWQLLEKTFLNKKELVERTLDFIINHKSCKSLEDNVTFIEKLRSRLVDLERLGLKFQELDAADTVMSFITRSKLSSSFLVELCRKLGHNYASMSEILDNCVAIHSLLKKGEVLESTEKPSCRPKNYPPSIAKTQSFTTKNPKSNKPIDNKENATGCKFCPSLSHSSTRCKTYPTYESRIKRAVSRNLCSKCLSGSHLSDKCFTNKSDMSFSCQSCKSFRHVTPMCPQMVLSLLSSKKIKDVGDTK